MQRYKESAESNVLGRQIEISALHKNEVPNSRSDFPSSRKNKTKPFSSVPLSGISLKGKKAEAKLKATEELWQFALEGAGDGVWEYNFRYKNHSSQKQYKRMLGYSDAEFKTTRKNGKTFIRKILGIIGEVDSSILTKESVHQVEYRVMHKDGKYRWILDRGIAVSFDADGNPNVWSVRIRILRA